VAALLVDSFYKTPQFVRSMMVLSVLSRLQNNYHRYHKYDHEQFVCCAIASPGIIVGFVDIDGGPERRNSLLSYAPRPYLSDLAISEAHRKKNLGVSLVETCEWTTANKFRKSVINLKVERDNVAAVRLYSSLGYEVSDDEKVLRKINENQLFLFKNLTVPEELARVDKEANGSYDRAEEWDKSYEVDTWDEKVKFDAQRGGSGTKQNDILGKELKKG
jgi:GNAT superfamily N-acetyltransferase